MSMYKRNRRINLLFAVYLVAVSVCVLFLFIFGRYIYERSFYLNGLLDNSHVGIDINLNNMRIFSDLKYDVHQYAMAQTLRDMAADEKIIMDKMSFLRERIDVLENGGTVAEDQKLNDPDTGAVEYNYSYFYDSEAVYNTNLLEMLAKVSELEGIVSSYRAVLTDRISARKTGNTVLLVSANEKLSVNEKTINSFFSSSEQIFTRFHIESLIKLKKLENYRTVEMKTLYGRFVACGVSMAAALVVSGVILLVLFRGMSQKTKKDESKLTDIKDNFDLRLMELTDEISVKLTEEKERADKLSGELSDINQLVNAVDMPLYLIDAVTYEIKYANTAALNTWNSDKGTCYALTHMSQSPCAGAEHPCPLSIVRTTGAMVILEHIHKNQDGSDRYFEVRGYPIFDTAGKLASMLEVSLDITERKHYELALLYRLKNMQNGGEGVKTDAASISRYITLLDNVVEIIMLLDAEGRIVFTGTGIRKIAGYGSEHVDGHFLEDLLATDERSVFNAWLDDVKSIDMPLSAGFRMIKKNGDVMPSVFTGMSYLSDENIKGIVITIQPNILT